MMQVAIEELDLRVCARGNGEQGAEFLEREDRGEWCGREEEGG